MEEEMAKDPAFLFYPGDWLGGTMTFTRAQKGAYMDLLMAQFNQVALTIEDIKQVLGSDFDSMWEQKLRSKFEVEADGKLYYNKKMREETIKRKIFTESRRKNLSKAPHHMMHHMTHHMINHMEDENEDEDRVLLKEEGVKGKKEVKRFKAPTLEEVQAYAKERNSQVDPAYFLDKNQAIGWVDKNGNKYKDWKAVFRNWEAYKKALGPQKPAIPSKRPIGIVVVEKIAAGKDNSEIMQDLAGLYTMHDIIEALRSAGRVKD